MREKKEEKHSVNAESDGGHKEAKQAVTSHFDEEQKGGETSCDLTVL